MIPVWFCAVRLETDPANQTTIYRMLICKEGLSGGYREFYQEFGGLIETNRLQVMMFARDPARSPIKELLE